MGILNNPAVMRGMMGLGSVGKKGGKIRSAMGKSSGVASLGDIPRAQQLVKMGRRRAAIGGGALALGVGSSRGSGRGATGNGYMPVGTSSGGQGY